MFYVTKTLKKTLVALVLLGIIVLPPIALAGSPARAYAAGVLHTDVSATAVENTVSAPENKKTAETDAAVHILSENISGKAENAEDLKNNAETFDSLDNPEVLTARQNAERANEQVREEKDQAWMALKKQEKEKADAEARAAAKSSKSGNSSSGTLVDLGKFHLTAYCPCYQCTGGWGGRTSSGTIAKAGHTIATDPGVIPSGTKVKINGTVYTAEDTGSGIDGNHIDIFFNEHQEALNFGSQYGEVYLVK